jgi:hypothetical protein
MKILICGDSFAADWQIKYPEQFGWPNMLANDYKITNLAQAGCSEFKIYQQIKSANLREFDKIVISHTSPYRIYVNTHPVHYSDKLHRNSDLIYEDLKEHEKTNKNLSSIIEYYENYFDIDYAIFIHNLICEKINNTVKEFNVIHIVNIEWDKLYQFSNMLNFEYLFKSHRGLMNHYDQFGNLEVYNKVKSVL